MTYIYIYTYIHTYMTHMYHDLYMYPPQQRDLGKGDADAMLCGAV